MVTIPALRAGPAATDRQLSPPDRVAGVLSRIPLTATVFVVALAARLTVILRHGGLHGWFGYDAGVYFAGSDAFLHGRMPYRNFVLLHPPGLMLALTPFALLTRVMTDDSAFTVAVLGFAVLGAVNAALVVRVCLRLGLGGRAAAAGGLFYALWSGAIDAEYLPKLEPLGNLCMLLALLAALRAQRSRHVLAVSAVAGLGLGAAVSIKIWWIVPVLGVLAWHAARIRSVRAVGAVVAGAVGSAVVINLPFFVHDPRGMWTSVVLDQLGRNPTGPSTFTRMADLSTLPRLVGTLSVSASVAVTGGLSVLIVAVTVRAWRVRIARPVVLLLLAQLAVVLAAPSWFAYYCDYLAIAVSVTVAAAASRPSHGGARHAGWFATAAAAAVTVPTLVLGTAVVQPFPAGAQLARDVAGVRCVMTDSPMAQIQLDALSRGLAAGCPNWIDVTGRTYGPDRATVGRRSNAKWQHDLTRYLRSGGAIIIVRAGGTGVAPRTARAIARDGVLARAGGHVVYRVNHG